MIKLEEYTTYFAGYRKRSKAIIIIPSLLLPWLKNILLREIKRPCTASMASPYWSSEDKKWKDLGDVPF